jgi:hypothetical protein
MNCTVTFTTVIVGTACATGINELQDNDEVSLMPNPNHGSFYIETTSDVQTELVIFNNLGQEVHKQILGKGKNKIDLISLSSGVYYYSIKGQNYYFKKGKILLE